MYKKKKTPTNENVCLDLETKRQFLLFDKKNGILFFFH